MIRTQAEKSEKLRGMATTLIAACVDDQLNCTMVNVGDSRGQFLTPGGTRGQQKTMGTFRSCSMPVRLLPTRRGITRC